MRPTNRRGRGAGAIVVVTAALLVLGLSLTGCGPAGTDGPGAAGVESGSGPANDAAIEEEGAEQGDVGGDREPQVVPVVLPFIPAVAVPDVSVLGATGDVVADRLGDLVSPTTGVELLTATCGTDGSDLLYRGSTGTDVFAIERDGSGVYIDQSDDGLVSLEVDDSGAGEYYDRSGGELITIKAAADGSGEYYSDRDDGLITLKAAGDGSGEYVDDRDGVLLTITQSTDGTAQYYRQTENELLTIQAVADGSGEYYWKPTDGPVVTLRVEPTGGWVLTTSTIDQLVEVTVAEDGSGRYRQTGRRSLDFTFNTEGRSSDGAYEMALPEDPRFSVAGRFPDLGRLGSLSPPCATVLRFDAQLLFDFGQSTLRPEADGVLDEVTPALNEAGRPIEINGHTDAIGGDAYNDELSLARAEAVRSALADRGLTVDVTVNGWGEQQPVAANETEAGADDPAGRALNRRVEIVIPEG